VRSCALFAGALAFALAPAAERVAPLAIDYPSNGSVFPPEFPAPLFLWRDAAAGATAWTVEVTFGGGAAPIRVQARGEPMRLGEIDPRAVAPTNSPPRLSPAQAAARTWRPSPEVWAAIKAHSTTQPATITIAGRNTAGQTVSRGRIVIRTSTDRVAAPVFYRDVPLMPSETEKGVIKPLASSAIPLIAWRLRNVGETSSRVLMQGLHTCANCHSFSVDGKTMGMDVDGPQNDKGLYALVPVRPRMSIGNEQVVAWSTFRGKLGGRLRVGFMSQVSPNGQFVVTTINDPGMDESEYQRRKNLREVALNFFVANFKDYRFLQVFYPTRGILAWYNRAAGVLQPLPGADDPRYVHTNAVWSPDGSYLVFARADAKDPYEPGARMAERANDPAETQMRYDLYRIPFNGGKGGIAEPIAGASGNGMSNSFPKVSPDGRWIVFVQCRNGQLMRPDSQLHIVPAGGGPARRMRCNTPLMNSWHSFSPNGRWLAFSSKSRSPYTQLFLTHIDEEGNDSPAVLIENSTAANRAVNIPEFVNIPPDGMLSIEAPVTDYYRVVDLATELAKKGRHQAAVAEWKKALELSPGEARAHNNLGVSLTVTGETEEAISHFRTALELSPEYPEALNNLGDALVKKRRLVEAIPFLEKAIELNPRYASAHSNLGSALAQLNRLGEAIPHLEKAVAYKPDLVDAHNNLGVALMIAGRFQEALPALEKAVKLTGGKEPMMLDLLARVYAETGRFQQAAQTARRAVAAAIERNNPRMAGALKSRVADYESKVQSQQ
jgi:Flp pilus assembly protein TadD